MLNTLTGAYYRNYTDFHQLMPGIAVVRVTQWLRLPEPDSGSGVSEDWAAESGEWWRPGVRQPGARHRLQAFKAPAAPGLGHTLPGHWHHLPLITCGPVVTDIKYQTTF